MHLLYGIAFVWWGIGTLLALFWYHDRDQKQFRYQLNSWEYVLVAETFFTLATMMAFIRVLQVLKA